MVRVEVQVEYTYKINRKQYSCDFSVYVKEVALEENAAIYAMENMLQQVANFWTIENISKN